MSASTHHVLVLRWTNVCRMLLDRGYPACDDMHQVADCLAKGELPATECYLVIPDKLAVVVPRSRSLDKEGFQRVMHLKQEHGVDKVLVITRQSPSVHTANAISRSLESVEHHNWAFFDFCVVRHEAVPIHRRFVGSWRDFQATVGLEIGEGSAEDVLPHILRSDPVVRYYNWPIGSIILIHRPARNERSAELAARVVVSG